MENTSNNKISLRPFLQTIKHLCENMTNEDFSNFIMFFAETIPAKKRIDFLDHLYSYSNAETGLEFDETLIDKISDLKNEVKERIESIDDGSFYDENGWDSYDDEELDYLSEDHKRELEEYFAKADTLFLQGKLSEAENIYKELYSFFDNNADLYGPDESSIDIEQRETRARYCRCIYESSKPSERAKNLRDVIAINASVSEHHFDIYENNDPLFIDIKNSRIEELPDEGMFLIDWIKVLKEYDSDRANLLLLEATYLKDGIDGITKLARKWKSKQPRGYLFWINLITVEEDWDRVVKIAKEAISELQPGYLRELAAEKLINAGEKINNVKIILEGKREVFYSVPDDNNLITLIKEANKQNVRNIEIENVLAYLKNYKDKELEVKVLLMKGDISTAFLKAKHTDVSGWSYSNRAGAVLFAGLLSALVRDKIQKAVIIKSILKRYTDVKESYSLINEKQDKFDLFIFNEIITGLKDIYMTDTQQSNYIDWVEKTGRKRIEGIVSNKHRKSYTRAAEILCGLAECFTLLGNAQKGLNLIYEYRDGKYNRYPAFKREFNSILLKSEVI